MIKIIVNENHSSIYANCCQIGSLIVVVVVVVTWSISSLSSIIPFCFLRIIFINLPIGQFIINNTVDLIQFGELTLISWIFLNKHVNINVNVASVIEIS